VAAAVGCHGAQARSRAAAAAVAVAVAVRNERGEQRLLGDAVAQRQARRRKWWCAGVVVGVGRRRCSSRQRA